MQPELGPGRAQDQSSSERAREPAPPTTVSVVIAAPTAAPGCLVRAMWFLFIGWWLGGWAVLLAWLLNVTVVGLPAGLWLLNRLPQMMTLRPVTQRWEAMALGPGGTVLLLHTVGLRQYPWYLRALYFVLMGWWFSFVWFLAAYLIGLTVFGLPLSFWMFGRAAAVTTLRRT